MPEKTIQERVNHAFDQLDERQFQLAQSFISLLEGRVRTAEQSVARQFLTFLLSWTSIYLVARGFIAEAEIAGAKITKVQHLLIAGPIALGYLSYQFSAALSSVMIITDVVRAYYIKFIPKLNEDGIDLDTLISSAMFVFAEQQDVLSKRSWVETILAYGVLGSVVFFAWAVSLAAIVHVAYMLFQMAQWSRLAIALSTLIGGVLWLRGASMIYHRTAD